MSATCPDPVYVAHFCRRDPMGHVVAAKHYRLNAPHPDAAEAIAAKHRPPMYQFVGVRPASHLDKQTWLVYP